MIVASWTGRAVSENRRLAKGKGRWIPNEDYQAFKDSIAWVVRAEVMDRPPISGPVQVRLFMELNPLMDAANIIKPVLDGIELAGAIANDKQVRTCSFHREDSKPGGEDKISIVIKEME